jgi:predicted peroxiredoxin
MLGYAGGTPCIWPRAARDCRLGTMQRLCRDFQVDPRTGRERELDRASPLERDDAAELRQQRREGFRGRAAGPDGLQQLVTPRGALSVGGEVDEEESPLPPGQLVLHAPAVQLNRHAPAELDPRRPQGFCKVTTRRRVDNARMAKILIHVTHGPEHPTRAALGFLVGKAAVAAGHEVSFFLAGDAVQLLREAVLDNLVGLGTGSLRDSYDAVLAGGGRFYVSGMSSKARGFEPDGIAEAAMPDRLVELALEHDRVLTY